MGIFSYKNVFIFIVSEVSHRRSEKKNMPSINFEATQWSNLINLSQTELCERALVETFFLPEELLEF